MATPDAPSRPVCPLGISERTLSALRDDAVRSRAEAARLAAHFESCPACRRQLSAFDDLAAALRSERPPEPDGRLWRAIATAAATPLPAGAPRSRIRRPRSSGNGGSSRPSWNTLGAVAAVLLLTVGFVALVGLHRPAPPVRQTPTATPASTFTPAPTATPSPTAIATPVLLPAHPLAWQPVGASAPSRTIAVADDGESAYACSVGSDAQGNAALSIWRTADRGAHWMPAREVPSEPTVNGCLLVVDASDPSVAALAWAPRGGGAGNSYTGLMTTVDGGATWQAVPQTSFTQIDQLDSRGGVIYALRETVGSTNAVEYHLWASGDRMQSWRQVDHGLPAAVAGFWLQPEGPGILIVVSGGAADLSPSQLWSSPDGGTTWHQLAVPGGLPSHMPAGFAGSWTSANCDVQCPHGIVARSFQGRFHICVSDVAAGPAAQNNQPPDVTCSLDGGATWQARTMLLLTTPQGISVGADLVGIANDGTLLAAGLGTLYRLAAGADHWQPLGPLPELVVAYCPAPDAGILWAAPAAGPPVGPQDRIFTASYTP